MNLRRYWPGLVLFVTLVIGAIAGGVGGAVVTSTIAMLVVGPGYLIQQRVRRRRGGAAPSGRGLGRDADEVMTAIALTYLGALNKSRRVRFAVYSGGVALVALCWVVAGRDWAVAWVVVSLTLTLVSFAWRLHRR
jgi:hypothetical protein